MRCVGKERSLAMFNGLSARGGPALNRAMRAARAMGARLGRSGRGDPRHRGVTLWKSPQMMGASCASSLGCNPIAAASHTSPIASAGQCSLFGGIPSGVLGTYSAVTARHPAIELPKTSFDDINSNAIVGPQPTV